MAECSLVPAKATCLLCLELILLSSPRELVHTRSPALSPRPRVDNCVHAEHNRDGCSLKLLVLETLSVSAVLWGHPRCLWSDPLCSRIPCGEACPSSCCQWLGIPHAQLGVSSTLGTAAPLGTAVPWGQQHSEDSSALGMAVPREQQCPGEGSTQ